MNLDSLGLKYGTDKASNEHGYLDIYEQYIGAGSGGSLLELGWLDGASMRMWREWLGVRAVVTGVDMWPKDPIPGVNFVLGDVTYPATVQRAAEYGPFDFIIDDASHISSATIKSFDLLWPYLKPGGLYFVEDLSTSYYEHWGGHFDPDQPGREGQTIMQFLRRLTDTVHTFWRSTDPIKTRPMHPTMYDVQHIAFWPDLCMVQRAS